VASNGAAEDFEEDIAQLELAELERVERLEVAQLRPFQLERQQRAPRFAED
jgi:hypothetical protein